MTVTDEERWNRLARIDDFQRYLERMASEHEALRVRAHAKDATEAFLRIVECLDEALRQSVSQTGEIAAVFLGTDSRYDMERNP